LPLRIYVAVPEPYARAAQPGATASVTLDEFPGRPFQGTLVRTANAIDLSSRSLLEEVDDVANPNGLLLPGAYIFVHLSLPGAGGTVTVLSNTLLFRRERLQVAIVRDGRTQLGAPEQPVQDLRVRAGLAETAAFFVHRVRRI